MQLKMFMNSSILHKRTFINEKNSINKTIQYLNNWKILNIKDGTKMEIQILNFKTL